MDERAEFIFKVVHDGMRNHYETFVDDVTTTIAAILLVIGWMFTSEKAREFVAKIKFVRWFCIVAVGLGGVLSVLPYYKSFLATRKAQMLLDGLSLVDRKYYEQFVISKWHLWTAAGATLLLCAFLGLVILWLPAITKKTNPDDPTASNG